MQNESGVIPLDLRVIVKRDDPETKIGSIIIPDLTADKEKYAKTKGTIIAVGTNAWQEAARHPDFVAPQPGDRVMIGKYAGSDFKGLDGADYTIMNDEDVVGLLIE